MCRTIWIKPKEFALHGGEREVGEVGLGAQEAVYRLADVEEQDNTEDVYYHVFLLSIIGH